MKSQRQMSKFEKEMKKEEEKMMEELVKEDEEAIVLKLVAKRRVEVEKTDTDSEDEYDTGNEYESASEGHVERSGDESGTDSDKEDKENEENEEDHSDEYSKLIYWRINFRNRHRVKSDTIMVDSTTPPSESSDPFSMFRIGPNGELIANYFLFHHILKESSYKNKYVIRLDGYKLTFSERDDSILIQSATEAILHMGTSNNTLFRNRNMAMEELQKLVGMKIHVRKSLFSSNRSEQMGDMDLSKCVGTITAENLSIAMDSCENVVQIINLHQPVLNKFTLICSEDYSGILELEQIQKCPKLKLDGPSGITNEQLATIKATHFEISSEKIDGEGINAFLKACIAQDIPNDFYAQVRCRGVWETENVFKGLDSAEYKNEEAYVRVNGCIPLNIYECTFASIPTNKPGERLAVLINNFFFECFKEGKSHSLLSHDITPFE